MPEANATTTTSSWQYVTDNAFAEGNWVTFTDKLLGLEVCADGPGKEVVCVPIPPREVPSLIRKLIAWSTDGNIAIVRDHG